MTPRAKINLAVPERPQDEGKKSLLTHHIGAKVSRDSFQIIDNAALIRGLPRSEIVSRGALEYAQRVLEQATGTVAAFRRIIRKQHAQTAARGRKKAR
ncbi:MAG TPA: hypothetical protein VF910_01065 [Candidatus Bathyarchaeia archaeon]